MADIAVSIDSQGDITCPDATLAVGTPISWSVTGGTITSITPGKPSPFSTAPSSTRGQWSATVSGAGSYTITDSVGKTRTPRITVVSPMAVKKN